MAITILNSGGTRVADLEKCLFTEMKRLKDPISLSDYSALDFNPYARRERRGRIRDYMKKKVESP